MDLSVYFKSIIDEDISPIVICDLNHTVIYMNPSAVKRYKDLCGKSLLKCHNADSAKKINSVIDWFKQNNFNNRVHTFYNPNENKDVYMIALRDENGNLIGYYEKHEYRTIDKSAFYELK